MATSSSSAVAEAEKAAIISEIEENLTINATQKTKSLSQVPRHVLFTDLCDYFYYFRRTSCNCMRREIIL